MKPVHTHIDALLAEQREPVLCDAVEAGRLGDGVDETDDVRAAELREEVCAGAGISWRSIST